MDPVIIVFCVSAILSSLAQTYIFSEKFLTVTTIQYKPQEITRLRAQDTRAFGAPLPTIPFKIINQNMQEIATSEAILRPVVIELGLDQEEKKFTKDLGTNDFTIKPRTSPKNILIRRGSFCNMDDRYLTPPLLERLRDSAKTWNWPMITHTSFYLKIVVVRYDAQASPLRSPFG